MSKICTNVKGNNVSKSIKHGGHDCLRLWWLKMHNKQLWSSKKVQYLLRWTSIDGNNRNQNLCRFCVKIVASVDSKTEWNVCFMQHQQGSEILRMFRWWGNRFSLQQSSSLSEKLASHFEAMPLEMPVYFHMPSNYIISDVGARSVVSDVHRVGRPCNCYCMWYCIENLCLKCSYL